jgi:hypothetical protein
MHSGGRIAKMAGFARTITLVLLNLKTEVKLDEPNFNFRIERSGL